MLWMCDVLSYWQNLKFLKSEMAEFQQQMKQEVERFDQYKREETGKLR